MTAMQTRCPSCRQDFKQKYKGQVYCSKRCWHDERSRRRQGVCRQCGKTFQRDMAKAGTGIGKWYCSKVCYGVARTKWSTIICGRCGAEVQVKPRYVGKRRYCADCKNYAGALTRSQRKITAGRTPVGIGSRVDLGFQTRSRWEANYARYLKHLRIPFKYEPAQFLIQLPDGRKSVYTPDFLVGETYFVEVKGWMRPFQKMLMANAVQQMPQPVHLLQRQQYEWIEKAFGAKIPHWEFQRQPRMKKPRVQQAHY